jgi:drug/metabolite transporter (DMT)-like permease
VGVVFGLLAAFGFGTGDFLGGRASTRVPAHLALLICQAVALAGAVVLVVAVDGELTGTDVRFGLAAGAVNGAGLGVLYRGLAVGRASVVAPITAVVGAVVPVSWGLATGERPSGVALGGILAALVAAGLIAREADDPATEERPAGGSAILLGVVAGALLGTSFIFFAQTTEDSGMWPVLFARVAATALAAAAVLARPVPRGIVTAGAVRLAALAGVCDVGANAFVIAGIRRDLAVIVAPIASLAPGFTVTWSLVLLRERTSRPQRAGLLLALGGLVLIAAG